MSYYITTSIPYVNAAPHLGHALEYVQADAFARYQRLRGEETYFLSGTDENSLKVAIAAEREGIPIDVFVSQYSRLFFDLTKALGVSEDAFIRTSQDPRQRVGVAKFWEACAQRGDIYQRAYRGLYCVGCEQFYQPKELIDGRCPEHLTVPEVVEEVNYFFRLSRYADRLTNLIDSGDLRIIPETRRNEVRAFIARGLEDISISRSHSRAHGWGILVPGDPDQVIYVWFDALTNYMTALDYAEDAERYRRYWVNNPQRVHVIGKGILRFHAVYWPAMLLSAGVPLPRLLFVHGYLTVEGQKISKSLGNAVDPFQLIDRFGKDALRYWLLRDVPPTADADYGDERLIQRYNADLANGLGNLLSRTASMVHRYRNGVVPTLTDSAAVDQHLAAVGSALRDRLNAAMADAYNPQAALAAIWELVTAANRYVEETAPWVLAKAEQAGDLAAGRRLDKVLSSLVEALRIIAEALRPFLPDTAAKLAEQLGITLGTDWSVALEWSWRTAGQPIPLARPFFPRIEIASS